MTKKHEPKAELWPIEKIKPYDRNAKIHTTEQVESLAKIIKREGWNVPIVVDKSGVIIKGHGRRLAAIHLGLTEVPVICASNLSEAEVRAARLADNRVALGDFDYSMVTDELRALNEEGFEMGDIGFNTKELDLMLNDMGELDTKAFDEAEETAGGAPADEPRGEVAPNATVEAEKKRALTEVLGFRSVPDSSTRVLAKFQAIAEEKTGQTGSAAFCEFVKSVVTDFEAQA